MATALNLVSLKPFPFGWWYFGLRYAYRNINAFLQKLPWYLAWLLLLYLHLLNFAGARFEVLIELPLWQFWIMYGAGWASMFLAILILNNRMLAKK